MAVTLLALFGGLAIAQAPAPEVGPDQFLRLMRGLHAEYRDVAFIYEGTYSHLDHGLTGERATVKSSYQGYFAARDDGAALYDVFIREADDPEGIVLRNTYAILDGAMVRLGRTVGQRAGVPEEGKAGGGVLGQSMSAGRLNRTWYFQALEDPAALHYEFQGWEEVDGHRCLRVQLDYMQMPGPMLPERHVLRFWIDMERGGHPLKVEHWQGETLWYRTDDVRLDQVPTADRKTVWLPVKGRTQQFTDSDLKQVDEPVARETYSVAFGTARINAGLPDEVFSVNWKGGLPDSAELKRLRETPAPAPRNDPQGVQERLDATLAKADAQADRLEASSAARETWDAGSLWSIGLAAFGILLIGGIVVYRWRMR